MTTHMSEVSRQRVLTEIFWTVAVIISVISDGIFASFQHDCSPNDNPEIVCTANRLSKCNPVFLQETYPQLYRETDEFTPAKPASFSEVLFNEPFPGGPIYQGVNLTFSTPRDGSIKFLKGFELMIYKFDQDIAGIPTSTSCIIFDLSNNTLTWGLNHYNTQFHRKIYPLEGKKIYVLQLYSLPKPPIPHDQKGEITFFSGPSYGSELLAKDWFTGISYHVEGSDVKFKFSPPPERFGFTKFYVSLVEATQMRTQNEDFITEFAHEFSDVPTGTYEIHIQPYDQQQCLCKDGNKCTLCLVTVTPIFNVTSSTDPQPSTAAPKSTQVKFSSSPSETASPDSESSSDPPLPGEFKQTPNEGSDDDTTMIVLSCVGSVICLAMFVSILAILFRRRKRGGSSTDMENKEKNGEILFGSVKRKATWRRKTVHLVYFQDHEKHLQAVESLAVYLQRECFCDVRYAPWFLSSIMEEGINIWSLNAIQKADFTLFIHSEGSYRHYLARRQNRKFHGDEKWPLADLFMPSFLYIVNQYMSQLSYRKFIMAQFDHSSTDFVPREVCPGVRYKLPKHLKELINHIHGVSPGIDQSIVKDNLHSTIEGRKLLEACKGLSAFERKNPEWFRSLYGEYIEDGESLRHDSGVDTSMLNLCDEDKLSFGSVEHTGHKDDMSWIPPSEIVSTAFSLHPLNVDLDENYHQADMVGPEATDFLPSKGRSSKINSGAYLNDCIQRINNNYEKAAQEQVCGRVDEEGTGSEVISLGGQSV